MIWILLITLAALVAWLVASIGKLDELNPLDPELDTTEDNATPDHTWPFPTDRKP